MTTTLPPSTLAIKDLPLDEEMDHEAMAAVRGGMTYGQAFKNLQDLATGSCELSSTGKSIVCY
ncbi:hypothetical protein CupriaWKF_09310 [Cupriavidus sp. WKF15]|uniref:hypothetical protein n=1 Tax=Cupriavidus sp. WKF15 TaxID=3032282 RepID=UPI0023E22345|nr:hypothetical protein [Cupriavidus sp. WKF15]WER44552.1 hypothetical protein CupriaWKF_09310 [Cupriavidus sp. WKF15]